MTTMLSHEKAYYVEDRSFSVPELKILIDAVHAASFVTEKKTAELIRKIANLGGSHSAEILQSNMVYFNTRKHRNESIYYNVDYLEDAIEQKKKVIFYYFDLNENGEKVYRNGHHHYVVEPIALVFNEDNYYMVCYSARHDNTANYRVDRMDAVEVIDEDICEKAIELRSSVNCLTEQAFKMYGGQTTDITIQFSDKLIGVVYDKFGEDTKGDAIINKTYIKDCLSKKVMVNNGERPKYYVENNHPAIIDAVTFGRVQEELARRSGKPKTKQVGTKTEQGKYSSKYAMTELLVCGECKTPYRRCTWTVKGQKKIVWRCINRLDFGKKYCHNSPTVEESILQRAVMRAIMETAQQNLGVLQTLKVHIGMGLQTEQTEDNSMELQIRIAEIDAEFKAMLAKISTDTVDAFDEEKAKRLMDEKARLQQQLGNIRDGQLKREQTQSRLDDIYTILDGLKNRPMEYDEQIVRQLLECITVDSKEQITVIFVGGLKVVQPLID